MSYVNFNSLTDRFSEQIYATRKGRLRMQLIDALYKQYLPNTFDGVGVLDAAGGLGQMSRWFLEKGAKVDYFDVSREMVEKVDIEFSSPIKAGVFKTQCCAIDRFQATQPYDFVNAHAVLEWLENPFSALNWLTERVKPGGYLGLMVYNKHMLMLRHLMRGTLSRAMTGDLSGIKGGLTPISPLDPADVLERLKQQGFDVLCHAGIRSFSDLAEKTVVEWYDEADVFDAELALCRELPYRDMARYVLFIAQKK